MIHDDYMKRSGRDEWMPGQAARSMTCDQHRKHNMIKSNIFNEFKQLHEVNSMHTTSTVFIFKQSIYNHQFGVSVNLTCFI